MKRAIALLSIALLALSCQQAPSKADEIQLEGRLERRQWAKSPQSYCAGGSDYWVLLQAGSPDETVLKPAEPGTDAPWQALDGRPVRLSGRYQELVRESTGNPMEQRPVSPGGGAFTCTVFLVARCEALPE
jgi:hypothetical protein